MPLDPEQARVAPGLMPPGANAQEGDLAEVQVLLPEVTAPAAVVPYERTVGHHANTAVAAHLRANNVP